jgi:hypothetical protein
VYYCISKTSTLPPKQIIDAALAEARNLYASGETVEISVSVAKKSRTGQQNKYFWALCGLIEKHTGEDKEVIKMRLMHAMGFVVQAWSMGQAVVMPMSTTKLKTGEFAELINATQSLCENLNIKYPLPAELGMQWT